MCDCIKNVDEKLKEKNLHITGCSFFPSESRRVTQVKIDWIDRNKAPKGQKNSPPSFFASFCPFCGEKIKK